jgi:hypothetical protein
MYRNLYYRYIKRSWTRNRGELVKICKRRVGSSFTAMNVLGLGVDAPTMRVIIYVGMARKLRDYMNRVDG